MTAFFIENMAPIMFVALVVFHHVFPKHTPALPD